MPVIKKKATRKFIKKASKHFCVWTGIAPEAGDEPQGVWQWCIRCGRLKLGSKIFCHGPKQKLIIVAEGEKA